MNSRQPKNKRERRAREIQRQIRQVLLDDFQLLGFAAPEDEYDCLIGGIYRLLVRKADQEDIVQWLVEMSTTHFGMPTESEACRLTAAKLLTLNVEVS
jgi:hypothetical protein